MRNKILGVFAIVLLGGIGLIYAHQKDMGGSGMMPMMRKKMGGRQGKVMMMSGMMMAMPKSIVATEDGGIIVLVGNKLLKYDANLKLVKEIEVKIDVSAMMKKMKEMMEQCEAMMDSDYEKEGSGK